MRYYGDDDGWAPYVSVGERKRLATQEAKRRLKKGQSLSPVQVAGRKITTTFWGDAWCENLNRYSDYANRLPRGRRYVCNGSVVDLRIDEGKIFAIVAGSEPYDVEINIKKLGDKTWNRICKDCAQSIHSLIDLMSGKLPDAVLSQLTDPHDGLFPTSKEISLNCDCPDGAYLCKHVAAVMYGIGNRLDMQPELFFKLRGVQQQDLVAQSVSGKNVDDALGLTAGDDDDAMNAGDLESIFGIDLSTSEPAAKKKVASRKKASTRKKKAATKKAATKKLVKKKAAKKKPAKKKPAKKKPAKKKPVKKKPVKKKPVKKGPAKKKTGPKKRK